MQYEEKIDHVFNYEEEPEISDESGDVDALDEGELNPSK